MTNAPPAEEQSRIGSPVLAADPRAVPDDESLPGLDRLFDAEWVWEMFCSHFGTPEETPERLRLRHFVHRPGERAAAGYVAERQWDRWVVEDQFAIELRAGSQERIFRYPDDPYLPGLAYAASALDAHELLPKYVSLHPHRLHVEAVRYRPTSRAVLRYSARWRQSHVGKVTLYVRVMPPSRMDRYMAAGELAERSGFAIPRLVGLWREGGVVWLANAPGKTVRRLIRKGEAPNPDAILQGLAQLWSAQVPSDAGCPLDVNASFQWTRHSLSEALHDEGPSQALKRATRALAPFAEAWRPSALAHNDFYDDQIILTDTGRIALVDFEEVGPGDPLFDVGNLLAHLRWMARFGISPDACDAYRRRVRDAALDRFGWEARALALREAYALFRLSSNPMRQFQRDWSGATEKGLSLVEEALDGVA